MCAFVKDSVRPQRYVPVSFDDDGSGFEYLWFCCKDNSNYEYFYCVLYHPPKPNYDSHALINRLVLEMDDIAVSHPGAVINILGDFNNLDHLRLDTEVGLTQIVKDITHGNRILDKFFTTQPELFHISVRLSTVKTKHAAVLANCIDEVISPVTLSSDRTEIFFPDVREQFVNALRVGLQDYNWAAVYNIDDIDMKYNVFMQIIDGMIKLYIPFKKVTKRQSDPWFVTPLIKSLLRRRNCLYHRGQINNAEILGTKINKLIAEVRSNSFAKVEPGDSGKLWKMIRNKTNYKNNNSHILSLLGLDSALLENLNKHFSTVATDPDYSSERIDKIVNAARFRCSNGSVGCISEYEIYQSLSKVKKTSPGPDGIPYWLLKGCALELTPVIAHLVNFSFRVGMVPSAWKRAIITPVPKVSNVADYNGFQDLRPISVTPILCRMVERFVVKRYLWPALDNHEMDDQFAFRPSGSTTAALVYLLHHVYTFFEQGNDFVRCLMIDYSRAFDVVDHPTLLEELASLGLPETIFSWIADFLSGRSQAVKHNSLVSSFMPISRSIVQGSGLGPTLYIALARKLKTLSPCNKIPKYADDTSLLVPQHTDCSLELELKHVLDWSEKNKLILNTKKTKEIIFWRSNKTANKFDIPLIPGIERVTQAKLLGVILTSSLNWTSHIDYILSIAAQRFYLINKLKQMSLGINSLSVVFGALVISRITYALPAFAGNLLQSDINRIDAMLRKARRWCITNSDAHFDLLSIQADSSLWSKLQHSSHCLHQLLPPKKEISAHNLRTRSSQHNLPLIKSDKLLNSFVIRNAC
ncbi:MAG: reverse transcriptase family protein [Oscillospiraceae bacterium]